MKNNEKATAGEHVVVSVPIRGLFSLTYRLTRIIRSQRIGGVSVP